MTVDSMRDTVAFRCNDAPRVRGVNDVATVGITDAVPEPHEETVMARVTVLFF